jgi:glycosyltransferase involved in cell wall biosynthesis
MDVSVVVPTYNRAGVLGRALDSVFSQTRQPEQVIVVDDGSTDGTSEVIKRDYPLVTWLRQTNAGVSAARNRGIAEASSEWIAFLDSDDEWQPGKLERQLDALRQHPSFHICHTNEIWIRNGKRVNEGKRHAKSGGWIFQRCLPLCVISPSSVIVRRALLEELGGFDESLPVCEDYDMWLRICSRHPVLFLEEPLVVKHGGHDDQLSKRYWGMDRFRIHAIEKILNYAHVSPGDRAAAVRTMIEKIDVYIAGADKRGKKEEISKYIALRDTYRSGDS